MNSSSSNISEDINQMLISEMIIAQEKSFILYEKYNNKIIDIQDSLTEKHNYDMFKMIADLYSESNIKNNKLVPLKFALTKNLHDPTNYNIYKFYLNFVLNGKEFSCLIDKNEISASYITEKFAVSVNSLKVEYEIKFNSNNKSDTYLAEVKKNASQKNIINFKSIKDFNNKDEMIMFFMSDEDEYQYKNYDNIIETKVSNNLSEMKSAIKEIKKLNKSIDESIIFYFDFMNVLKGENISDFVNKYKDNKEIIHLLFLYGSNLIKEDIYNEMKKCDRIITLDDVYKTIDLLIDINKKESWSFENKNQVLVETLKQNIENGNENFSLFKSILFSNRLRLELTENKLTNTKKQKI